MSFIGHGSDTGQIKEGVRLKEQTTNSTHDNHSPVNTSIEELTCFRD